MFKFGKGLFGSEETRTLKNSQALSTEKDSLAADSLDKDSVKQDSSKQAAVASIKLALPNDNPDAVADWLLKELEADLAALPPIKEGEVALNGIYTFRNTPQDRLKVRCFVRNGADRPIRFTEVALGIVNAEGEVLARQIFDLSLIGEIPPGTARPVDLYFEPEAVLAPIPKEGWRLVFGMLEK